MKTITIIAGFALLLLSGTTLYGQENIPTPDSTQQNRAKVLVKTKTGETIRGYFLSQNKDFLVIQSESAGRIEIPTERIKSIEPLNGSAQASVPKTEEEYMDSAPFYLFTESAFRPKKGEVIIKNNPSSIYIAPSDNFSIGFGSVLLATVTGAPNLLISPTLSIPVNDFVAFKVGADAFVVAADGAGAVAVLNAGISIGDRFNNITATLNYGVTPDGVFPVPSFSVAGMARLSRRISVVTDNYWLPFDDEDLFSLLSIGVRFHSSSAYFDISLSFNEEIITEITPVGIPLFGVGIKL